MLRYKVLVLVGIAFAFIASAVPAFAASKEKILHSFYDHPAANPGSNLVFDDEGNLYGSTVSSGLEACKCGTVFRLSPQPGGGWSYQVLYQFKGEQDGGYPIGNLVFDKAGKLYGAMAWGYGGVFQLTKQPDGSWADTTIYAFKGPPDANRPYSGLTIDDSGNLYGTTQSGGANGIGSVYMVSPTEGGWSEMILHSFSGSDGAYPWGDVTLDAKGNVYGTTISGGAYWHGTVFKINPSGESWTETVLYSFSGEVHHGEPATGVYLDASGKIFGTLSDNGEGYPGAVFLLEPNSNGSWTETILHTFGKVGDGQEPLSDLVPDTVGDLYGTTFIGGDRGGYGVIYKLSSTLMGKWTESVFHSFDDVDGSAPDNNPVTFDVSGNMYIAVNSGGPRRYGGYGVVDEFKPELYQKRH